ncbi:MAG: hypothetical protein ABH845_04190, partial [Candidatus Omnitrophota bacterium]
MAIAKAIAYKLPETLSRKVLLVFLGCALVLAYIVDKNVSLSGPVLIGILAFGGILLIISTLFRHEFALYALIMYLPFSRVLPGDFGGVMTALNLTNILCLLVLIGWLNQSMQEGYFWEKSALHVPIFLFAF